MCILLLFILITLLLISISLNRINHSINDYINESKENANINSKSLDRNFTDILKEIKRLSYHLEKILQNWWLTWDTSHIFVN
jgi:peptidoglycan hydrolase CwlO-like protein